MGVTQKILATAAVSLGLAGTAAVASPTPSTTTSPQANNSITQFTNVSYNRCVRQCVRWGGYGFYGPGYHRGWVCVRHGNRVRTYSWNQVVNLRHRGFYCSPISRHYYGHSYGRYGYGDRHCVAWRTVCRWH